jgi:hypothetical protein
MIRLGRKSKVGRNFVSLLLEIDRYYYYCLQHSFLYTDFATNEITFRIILNQTILDLNIFIEKSINILTPNEHYGDT